MWCYETSSQQNWAVAFVLIGLLRRGAHAHIRRIKKDGEKALKVKTPFSIQCPDLLNERAVIQDWKFSLGVSKTEKQRHYQLQTLCNRVIVSCLNYLALFLRTGSSFFLYFIFKPLRKCISTALVGSLWVNYPKFRLTIPHLGCEMNTKTAFAVPSVFVACTLLFESTSTTWWWVGTKRHFNNFNPATLLFCFVGVFFFVSVGRAALSVRRAVKTDTEFSSKQPSHTAAPRYLC